MRLGVHVALDPSFAPCESCICKDGNAGFAKWEIKGLLEPTSSCPRRSLSAETNFYLSLFPHYRSGHLLFAGGLADQPAIYIEAMGIIDATVNAVQAEESTNAS